jgi:uncharacterized membrane protein YqjE
MSENGHSHRSAIGEFIALLEDQMDLASLEWEYEKNLNFKRIGAVIAAVFLGFAAFMFIQVAIVMGIAALGVPVGWACVILAAVYVLVAGLLLRNFAQRDPRVGAPFQGTRQEFRKNLRWISQIFS